MSHALYADFGPQSLPPGPPGRNSGAAEVVFMVCLPSRERIVTIIDHETAFKHLMIIIIMVILMIYSNILDKTYHKIQYIFTYSIAGKEKFATFSQPCASSMP